MIDHELNQIIFSTANPKPGYISKGRNGLNLFSNSIVSLELETGEYKWHFQEIENDLHNLDLASPPILFSMNGYKLIAQATKSGQLMIVNRENGEAYFEFTEVKFTGKSLNENTYTTYKRFPEWLQFSRRYFTKDDVNNLNSEFINEARQKISESAVSNYFPLVQNKEHIFYGVHGGAQWPGIALTDDYMAIIPSNNIAWTGRLTNSEDYNLRIYLSEVFNEIRIFFNNSSKTNLNKIFKSITNYKKIYKVDLYKYQRFETSNNIPLNKPPWGTITCIDLKNQKIKWQIPHGFYPDLVTQNNTGSEVFGSPVVTKGGIIFVAGTDDKKIRAYSIENGEKIWEDDLPYSSYGIMQILEYNKKQLLIINSSGGRNFNSEKGDTVIAYKLNN